MTLFVSPNDGISETTLEHIGKPADRIIDVELTETDARKLYNLLHQKLSVEVFGAVTFRLKGRLVI